MEENAEILRPVSMRAYVTKRFGYSFLSGLKTKEKKKIPWAHCFHSVEADIMAAVDLEERGDEL